MYAFNSTCFRDTPFHFVEGTEPSEKKRTKKENKRRRKTLHKRDTPSSAAPVGLSCLLAVEFDDLASTLESSRAGRAPSSHKTRCVFVVAWASSSVSIHFFSFVFFVSFIDGTSPYRQRRQIRDVVTVSRPRRGEARPSPHHISTMASKGGTKLVCCEPEQSKYVRGESARRLRE